MLDEKIWEISANVLVILNGGIANSSVPFEGVPRDGDELLFLAAFPGG